MLGWLRHRQQRHPDPALAPAALAANDLGDRAAEHEQGIADPRSHLQGRVRARGLEGRPERPHGAAQDLSDLPLVGRPRPQGQARRPPGAGGLLYDHAEPDESEFQLLPLHQHGLPERLRPREQPHRLVPDDPWRLLIGGLLRHDRRADRGDLRAGARVVLRRPELVPDPGVPVPDDAAEHGAAPQLAAHGILEDAQDRLRPFRGDAAGAEGRRLRPSLRVQHRDQRPLQFDRGMPGHDDAG